MTTQSGITISGVNEPYKVVSGLTRPKPGTGQVLVKSLAVGVNPIEPFMHHSGMLVTEWPAILGCDASGIVVELGQGVSRLKVGDHVLGCTRVGQNHYSTFQEAFLMDENLTVRYGGNVNTDEACTIGVGLYTVGLGVLTGLKMSPPPPGQKAEEKDEWVVILGASGSVGQYAVQLARLCGYKVLGSCSTSKASIPLSQGATATVNNRGSVDEQLAEIKKATGGKFARVFDASTYGYELAIRALETVSSEPEKWFSSVDDWSEMKTPASIHEYRTQLGHVGRFDEAEGRQASADLASWIPGFEGHLQEGTIRPLEYQLVDGSGFEKVIEGIALLESGKASKKIVVRVASE